MIKIKFSEEAKDAYDFLKKSSKASKKERMILDSLTNKLKILQENPHYGNPIRKSLIPSYYKKKYSANNLFRLELPQFWRLLYTLTNGDSEIEIIAFIIDVIDHKEYNKKFGYAKR
ncbi:MAG: hypothetical protein NTZ02_02440 [Candidatus Woesearchaeota archaeon]|nr:hypothetical protein [Candidatus Woesearchaeota archaeon]